MEKTNSNQKEHYLNQVEWLIQEFFIEYRDVHDIISILDQMLVLYVADECFVSQKHQDRLSNAEGIMTLRQFLEDMDGMARSLDRVSSIA